MKKDPKEIIEFHKQIFTKLLKNITDCKISTYDDIINYKAKGLLDEPLWKIVEAYGKYKVNYISAGVKEIADNLNMSFANIKATEIEDFLIDNIDYQLDGGIIISNKENCKVQLEHVTPRKTIIKEVLKLSSEENIHKYLDEKCIGCLVLKAEHQELNDDTYNNEDLWQRYKNAGIKVYDKEGNKWVWE